MNDHRITYKLNKLVDLKCRRNNFISAYFNAFFSFYLYISLSKGLIGLEFPVLISGWVLWYLIPTRDPDSYCVYTCRYGKPGT